MTQVERGQDPGADRLGQRVTAHAPDDQAAGPGLLDRDAVAPPGVGDVRRGPFEFPPADLRDRLDPDDQPELIGAEPGPGEPQPRPGGPVGGHRRRGAERDRADSVPVLILMRQVRGSGRASATGTGATRAAG